MATIKTLAMTPSSSLGYEHCLDEALADSRFLQVLAGNLLGSLQRKQYELQQTSPYEDDPVSAAATLRSIEDLITSLQSIRRDIDANIESFYNTPAKTFLQSNIEQLTAIYQLWYILPKLRPYIPDVASESPRSEEHGNITYRTSPAAEIQAWRETKKSVSTSGCFDREPRSLSVVPPNKMLDRDVKEIQDGRAMSTAIVVGSLEITSHTPAVCIDSLEDWWTRFFDRLDMPANVEAASRSTSSACWIGWETDGRIKRYGKAEIWKLWKRMTVETGLAEDGAIGWTRMKWTKLKLCKYLEVDGRVGALIAS